MEAWRCITPHLAHTQLADELHEMEVRIGVVSHTLLQLSLRNRRDMQTQALSDEEDV